MKAADGFRDPHARDVNHLHRVIAQRRDEQALAVEIDAQMIDAPFDVRKRDRARRLQGSRLRVTWCERTSREQERQREFFVTNSTPACRPRRHTTIINSKLES